MKQQFDKVFTIRNFIFFILAVIVGTLLHEIGHFFAGKFLGLHARLHYDRVSYLSSGNPKYYIFLTLGGIFSTIITGTIGFIMLLRQQRSTALNLKNHLYIILALFWSRELAFILAGLYYMIFGKPPYFTGDEGHVDAHFGFHNGTTTIVLGTIAFFILYWVTFKFVPKHLRLSFIISAFAGIGLGVYIWFFTLGPYLLP